MSSFFDVYFSPVITEHKYYGIELPFDINPNDFINWLLSIGEEIDKNNYAFSVCSMCEYACLWISKLAYDNNINPERLSVCNGEYGYGEHYWMMLDSEYIIDLTLKQFRSGAPELSITKKSEAISKTSYNENFDTQTYIDYINQFGINII